MAETFLIGTLGLSEGVAAGVSTGLSVLSAAGTAVSAFAGYQQARAEAAAQARNAQQQEYEADYAQKVAGAEAANFRRRFARLQGANRAAVGASGGTFSGSSLLALSDNAAEAQLEELTIRHSGTIGAARSRSGAAIDRFEARQTRRGAPYALGARLLTGAGELFGG